MDQIVREALLVCALLCFPVLIAAAVVGTIVAIVQAATQVQEQTLSLLPKLIVVAVMLVIFGPFGFSLCEALFIDVIVHVPKIIQGS